LASNKIDAGEMTSKFEFFNKQFSKSNGGMKGNHLLLFDGAK